MPAKIAVRQSKIFLYVQIDFYWNLFCAVALNAGKMPALPTKKLLCVNFLVFIHIVFSNFDKVLDLPVNPIFIFT